MARSSALTEGVLLGSGLVTAASLLLPWIEVSGRGRSTIDIIGTASALELLEGATQWIVLVLWVAIPVGVAVGLVAWSLHRHTAAALTIGAAGVLMLLCGLLTWLAVRSLVAAGWYVSMASALTACLVAIAAVRDRREFS